MMWSLASFLVVPIALFNNNGDGGVGFLTISGDG
jgi:hypothetical protein